MRWARAHAFRAACDDPLATTPGPCGNVRGPWQGCTQQAVPARCTSNRHASHLECAAWHDVVGEDGGQDLAVLHSGVECCTQRS